MDNCLLFLLPSLDLLNPLNIPLYYPRLFGFVTALEGKDYYCFSKDELDLIAPRSF